jgi:hypothetical protein
MRKAMMSLKKQPKIANGKRSQSARSFAKTATRFMKNSRALAELPTVIRITNAAKPTPMALKNVLIPFIKRVNGKLTARFKKSFKQRRREWNVLSN